MNRFGRPQSQYGRLGEEKIPAALSMMMMMMIMMSGRRRRRRIEDEAEVENV
jgi:uncharacterized protein (TIGR03382 family)